MVSLYRYYPRPSYDRITAVNSLWLWPLCQWASREWFNILLKCWINNLYWNLMSKKKMGLWPSYFDSISFFTLFQDNRLRIWEKSIGRKEAFDMTTDSRYLCISLKKGTSSAFPFLLLLFFRERAAIIQMSVVYAPNRNKWVSVYFIRDFVCSLGLRWRVYEYLSFCLHFSLPSSIVFAFPWDRCRWRGSNHHLFHLMNSCR